MACRMVILVALCGIAVLPVPLASASTCSCSRSSSSGEKRPCFTYEEGTGNCHAGLCEAGHVCDLSGNEICDVATQKGCSSDGTPRDVLTARPLQADGVYLPLVTAPGTQPPISPPPTTQAPTTQAPTTQSPTTQAPTTQAPTTLSPTTQAPTTPPPTTEPPTTQPPTSSVPNAHACREGMYILDDGFCVSDPCAACPQGAACQDDPATGGKVCIDCNCGFCQSSGYSHLPCCEVNARGNNCKSVGSREDVCRLQNNGFPGYPAVKGDACSGVEVGGNLAKPNGCQCKPNNVNACRFSGKGDDNCFVCSTEDLYAGSLPGAINHPCKECGSCLLRECSAIIKRISDYSTFYENAEMVGVEPHVTL
eukprot:CAMPEP_0184690070 /NCGR_PEP_ID=MMETSP0312-20130426/31014_1 /TAXON_ID=31354 /ORGANISM="Compsopogon coeruleus, Strain SAG 36.94" /LENGTH=364 /DNA_ID=CAMNT_0027147503 /DNA_START=606 /DNA_END=1701 /DNA_ORIENTATION=-